MLKKLALISALVVVLSACALKTVDVQSLSVSVSAPMVPKRSPEPLYIVVPDVPDEVVVREPGLFPGKVLHFQTFASKHLAKVMGQYFGNVITVTDPAQASSGYVLKVEVGSLNHPKASASNGYTTAVQFRAHFDWRAALYKASDPTNFLFSYAGVGESPTGYGGRGDTVPAWDTAIENGLQLFVEELTKSGVLSGL